MSTLMYIKPKNVGIASSHTSSLASRGSRYNRRESVDEIHLDYKQDTRTIIGNILRNLSNKETTKGKRLAYLNAFVKYLQKYKLQTVGTNELLQYRDLGYTTEEILLCLRICLIHEATVIRLAAFRVLRYLIACEEDLVIMNMTQIPHLVVRSLDVVLNNSAERLQATRLCQRILAIPNGALHFPCAITRSLVAIGFDGYAEHDKLYRGSLSLLCQLALLNPMQFIDCGGVRVLLHNILGCTSPMVLEAMVGSLLHLMNVPETRDAAGVNLQSLVAPFTDVHYKHGAQEPSEKDVDEREIGYQCAKTAIGTVLKSWSGIAHFCQSRNSGLQALIDALYIEQLEIRRTILDLVCEIVGVKFPTWSDEVSVALSAVDPSYPQDSWKLQEGFIVQEALSVLPHLAMCTPNITSNHMALIVLSFIRRGLLEALVEVIVTGDTFISVRGTVLLGELLSLVDKYIPLDCYDPSQCIPTLIRYSSGGGYGEGSSVHPSSKPKSSSSFASSVTPESRQQRAMEAISVLTSLQKIKSRSASASSVFLQAQLEFAGYVPKRHDKFVNKLGQVQVSNLLKRDIEAYPTKLLKDTCVLTSKDSTTWQWDSIISLIKWAPSLLKRVDDSSWRNFLKRLIDYFKPSSNLFSRIELGKGQSKLLAKTGCALVQFLAEDIENFSGSVFLEELLVDIASHLDELLRQPKNPFACFLSPLKLESTLSQTYFLMIGKLSHSVKGYRILEKGDILQRFYNIVGEVHHESYIKLIVSSLSYREEYCKRILGAALSCSFDGSRLYATQFLRILVRAKLSGFSKWGMELLATQLLDKNRSISLIAMDILEEAIHDKMFLESLIALRPTLTHLGDRGLLLLVCFLSLPSGYRFLLEANFLKNEIHKWKTTFNKRYVELIEVLVRDSVSTLRRGEDGKYPERASRNQEQSKFIDIYVPPHLYGQLAQHKDGLELLLDSGDVDSLIEIVNSKRCTTPEETRELKASLWALAHFATSVDAVPIIEDSRVLENMVHLGRFCPILSVRHTVFHCLCLICVTLQGTEALRKYGWHGMPRNHHENYTIWTPEFYTNETRRLLRVRMEQEFQNQFPEGEDQLEDLDEEERMGDIEADPETCSNLLTEEDAEFFMMEEDLSLAADVPLSLKESPNFGVESLESESELLDSVGNYVRNEEPKISSSVGGGGVPSTSKKWSHAHHRSQSDSQTLAYPPAVKDEDQVDGANPVSPKLAQIQPGSSNSRGRGSFSRSGGGSFSLGGSGGGASTSTSVRSGSGSYRWRKSRSESVSDSTTSGVSSCDSSTLLQRPTQPSAEHIQTLSPIPSSASIATTICSKNSQATPNTNTEQSPPSRASSRTTLTEPITSSVSRYSFGSPSHMAYRSIKRKPIMRMPILSDSSQYSYGYGQSTSGPGIGAKGSTSGGSTSGRRSFGSFGSAAFQFSGNKTSSLDRHFIISPGDLFESKLMRVHSSLTSLSTPSFRIRPESETKGPCYMGLCVPQDFQSIFLTDTPAPRQISVESSSTDDQKSKNRMKMGDSFECHDEPSCMGCYKVKEEEYKEAEEGPTSLELGATATGEGVQLDGDGDVIVSLDLDCIVSGGGTGGGETAQKGSGRVQIVPDSPEGKALIRKEVLRLVSNLICSVGAKANEQGLLRLKQKFPKALQDLCLYTEVCVLMSNYNLRLSVRRFVQEVFFDLPYEEFHMVAKKILGDLDLENPVESPGLDPALPNLLYPEEASQLQNVQKVSLNSGVETQQLPQYKPAQDVKTEEKKLRPKSTVVSSVSQTIEEDEETEKLKDDEDDLTEEESVSASTVDLK